MNFIQWILEKLKNENKDEKTWQPEELRIEIEAPSSENDQEHENQDEKRVIIIDI